MMKKSKEYVLFLIVLIILPFLLVGALIVVQSEVWAKVKPPKDKIRQATNTESLDINDGRPPFLRGQGRGFDMPRGPRPFQRDERRGMGNRMHSRERMMHLRNDNPELADLIEKLRRIESVINRITRRYHETETQSKKEELATELHDLLEEHFELELRRQKMDIDLMEKKLQRIKALWKRRSELKDQFVERKFEEIKDMEFPSRKPFPPPGPPQERRGRGWQNRGRRGGPMKPPLPPDEERDRP